MYPTFWYNLRQQRPNSGNWQQPTYLRIHRCRNRGLRRRRLGQLQQPLTTHRLGSLKVPDPQTNWKNVFNLEDVKYQYRYCSVLIVLVHSDSRQHRFFAMTDLAWASLGLLHIFFFRKSNAQKLSCYTNMKTNQMLPGRRSWVLGRPWNSRAVQGPGGWPRYGHQLDTMLLVLQTSAR